MAISGFSSNGNYQIDVDAALQSQNRAENYSIIYWRVIVRKNNAYGHMATTNMGNRGSATSSVGDVWRNDNMSYEFRNGGYGGQWTIAEGTFRVNHDGQGQASFYFSASLTYYALGSASASTGWIGLPRLATEPPPPRPLSLDNQTQTSMLYRFESQGDGGLPVREWQVGWGRNGNYPEWFTGSWGTITISGLEPATTYYIWSRGRNDIGWSGWSARAHLTTNAGATIKVNGVWRPAVPYIKIDGQWRLAEPFIKHAGVWKRTG